MGSISSPNDDGARNSEEYIIVPLKVIGDLRITNAAFRVLTWGLGQEDDRVHTVSSIARALDQPERRIRNLLSHLRDLGYVTLTSGYHKGRRGLAADWTFHYPPLPTDNSSLGITDRALPVEPNEQGDGA